MSLMHLRWLTQCGGDCIGRSAYPVPTPFQLGRNSIHHSRSVRNSVLSRMWWCGCFITFDSSIICLRNVHPGQTTWHAWWSIPNSDRSSLLMQVCLCFHSDSSWPNRHILSSGNQTSSFSVSSCIGNIEADKRYTQPDTNIPRDVVRCHDQCGARSGSPQ